MDEDRFTGAARNLGGKIESAAGNLTGDNKTQASGMADQVIGTAQNAYGSVKESARQLAGDAPRYLDEALDSGQQYYRQGSQAMRDQFGTGPITELLLAGAAGYLLAYLVHGRS